MPTENPLPKLTVKQQQFADAYLGRANGNATEAAREAGYSEKSAKDIGYQLLHHAKVEGYIQRVFAERAIGADELLARIGQAARGEHTRFLAAGGERVYVNMEALLEAGLGHLVKGVKESFGPEGATVQNIEFADSQAAQALAARLLGLTSAKPEEPTRDDSIGAALDRKLAGLAAAAGAEPLPGEPVA